MKKNDAEIKRKIKDGLMKEESAEQKELNASLIIQKRMRGILSRKKVEEMRAEEMVFLGMARKPKTKEDLKNDPIEKMKRTQDERKLVQKNFMDEFETEKEELKVEINENEGEDIQDHMLKERRDWIHEYK